MKLLIKNGNVINFRSKIFEVKDVLIQGDKILKVDKNIEEPAAESIEARGLYVLPGLIDIHSHLREPGREDEEDIYSGSLSALTGGFTTVCAMPNTEPALDNAGLIKYVLERGREVGLVDVLAVGAITKGRRGEELSEMGKMKQAGSVAFSEDGNWVQNSLLMRRALEYSLMLDVPLILHSEDQNLTKKGEMNEGLLAIKMGLNGIPRQAEYGAIYRDIELARLTGARIHVTHISCKESVALIKKAKQEGLRVTADTCPHYLVLTEDAVSGYNTNAKINPPLRSEEDRKELIQALREGIIDCIGTDHAPHSDEEKDCEFSQASFGIIGFETALALGLKLVQEGELDLVTLIEKLSLEPAKILGLRDRGDIKPGLSADIIVLDKGINWKLLPENIVSRSKNTPFLNWEFEGKVKIALHKGKIVMDNFKIKEVEK